MDSELKKDYELSYLLSVAEAAGDLASILSNHQATPYYQSQLNSGKLMYPIKKQLTAFLGFCHFYALPEDIKKIKDALALTPSVLRFLIVTQPIKSTSRQGRPAVRLPESKPEQPAASLSNEALEQKLEEILK